jgi:acyl carrier protein
VADLGLSSLDVINVVVAFEDEFGIEIPDQIIKDLTTVGDIVRYLA